MERRQISYCDEVALALGEVTFFPDFAARCLGDGRLLFGEYFGLLGRPDYDEKNAQKLNLYAKS